MLKLWERLSSVLQSRHDAPPVPRVAVAPSSEAATEVMVPAQPNYQFRQDDVIGGRFCIVRPLGHGGMGEVYEAEDELLHGRIALKTVRDSAGQSDTLRSRFEQEVQLAKKVTHPNVCRIFDIGVHEEAGRTTLFLTMELLGGETLCRRLQRGRMDPAQALPVITQMAAALDAAHQANVIHRDFKTANVMLVPQCGVAAARAVVTDFGLARTNPAATPEATMTMSGAFVGTPEYMAPEQILGKPVSPATDVYALGLVIYEMVTGTRPFVAATPLEASFARLHMAAASPRHYAADLAPAWDACILRCLEREPERRFQSAGEVARALAAPSRFPTRRAAGLAAAMLLTGTVAVVTGRFVIDRARRAAVPAGPRFVALLPLRVAPGAAGQAYIATGLVDALWTKLAQLPDVRLASQTAAARAKADAGMAKVARELGVNLVLTGDFRVQAAGFGVSLELEDVRVNKRVWTRSYSGSAAQILEIQDQIYRDAAAALGAKLRQSTQPTGDIEAYDLYLRGRDTIVTSKGPKDLQKAIDLYQAALGRDPAFSLAEAYLSEAFLAMYRATREDLWSKKALHAAEQAQRIGDHLPEVHFTLGSVYTFTGRTEAAITEVKRALERLPNSDEGHRRLGRAYMMAGQKAEALATYEKSVAVNPHYWNNYYQLGLAYNKFGEGEKALQAFRRVAELEPDSAYGYEGQGQAYFRQGKYVAAIGAFEEAVKLRPDASSYSNLGTAYFYAGRFGTARDMFEKAVQVQPNNELYLGNLADAYRRAGQKEQAIATYNKAIARAYKDLNVNPRATVTMGSLSLYYARKGEAARATDFIGRARSLDPADVELMYTEGIVHALAGRNAEAMASLRSAFKKGYSVAQALREPDLENLAKLPEFQQLTREFGGGK
ncbi:MAG: tetratricopeptide repeat protein [Candidatus Solibacter sp.]|nr:tetratricopeptide repeat protein [Candidatus Solibacter sp.]